MKPDYDVIVVGARVAGASTALLLARWGHRVLLVDRAAMPSDTTSTHAILRTGVLQLARWGLLDRIRQAGTPPVRDFLLGFDSERVHVTMRDEFGVDALFAPRRPVLDGVLIAAAIEAGAEFADRTSMIDLHRGDDSAVEGIRVVRQRREVRVTSRVVVGADGIRSRVARRAGAGVYDAHAPTSAVRYAYYVDLESPGFWFQFTSGINAGMIRTNDGATCVFIAGPLGRFRARRGDPDTRFHDGLRAAGTDLAERVEAAERVSPFRVSRGIPGFFRRPWGPGWALVGDAGYCKDPISAHGISDALRDAELCGRAVDQALRDPRSATDAMWRYQRTRDELSRPLFAQSRALAAYGWDAGEASAAMRKISAAVRVECAHMASLPRPAVTARAAHA